ncbi:MAG: U32 family peptidase C-terminal domain-containing protein [Patescibacteria group bacterium]|jgi:putative protease
MSKLELLAPAGNILKMKTAFAYGADAVYLGIPDFSLRVRINDFNLKSIKEAVEYAHKGKKKVYVTINIFAHNEHLKKLPAYLKALRAMKVDALIVSDPGVINLLKKVWPSAEIHLSTQANCTNLEAARFWAKQGIKRIILGREVTLKEIKEIHQAAPQVELEYFVHGAMCMAYSGRCFLSKLLTNRSGNLGDCAQPCRWEYDVRLKTGGHDEELELVEEHHGAYLLNSKDLCLIEHLKELAAAGVTSFKIEGRAKSVYYQATVVGIYRQALSLINKKLSGPALKKELNYLFKELETKLVHRGYTTGFLLGQKADQNIVNSHNQSAWEFCGQVLKTQPGLKGTIRIYFQVHNTVRVGEQIEIIRPNYDIIKLELKNLWDAKQKKEIKEAHGGGGSQIAILELPKSIGPIPVLTVLRRKI